MLVYGQDERVTRWIAERLGSPDSFPCSASIGYERDGKLIAAVCFDNYTTTNVFAHIANDAEIMPPSLLVAVAAYVFVQLKAKRMTFYVRDDNVACIRLVEALGAKYEASLLDGHESGNMWLYVLWRDSRFYQSLVRSGRVVEEDKNV